MSVISKAIAVLLICMAAAGCASPGMVIGPATYFNARRYQHDPGRLGNVTPGEEIWHGVLAGVDTSLYGLGAHAIYKAVRSQNKKVINNYGNQYNVGRDGYVRVYHGPYTEYAPAPEPEEEEEEYPAE